MQAEAGQLQAAQQSVRLALQLALKGALTAEGQSAPHQTLGMTGGLHLPAVALRSEAALCSVCTVCNDLMHATRIHVAIVAGFCAGGHAVAQYPATCWQLCHCKPFKLMLHERDSLTTLSSSSCRGAIDLQPFQAHAAGVHAGLLWALLALTLSAEQRLDLAARAAEEGLRGAQAAHTGLLTKVLACCRLAQGVRLQKLLL